MLRIFPGDGEHRTRVIDLRGCNPGVLLQLPKDRFGSRAASEICCGTTLQRNLEETQILRKQVRFLYALFGLLAGRTGRRKTVHNGPNRRGVADSFNSLNHALRSDFRVIVGDYRFPLFAVGLDIRNALELLQRDSGGNGTGAARPTLDIKSYGFRSG